MKEKIDSAPKSKVETETTKSAPKGLDSISHEYGRSIRRRILRNFVDADEVPSCRQGTEINWAPSKPKSRWISTTEYPVARRLIRSPQFSPFEVIIQEAEGLRGKLTDIYKGESVCGINCHPVDPSVDFEESITDVLVDVADEEPQNMVLTPNYWDEGDHDE